MLQSGLVNKQILVKILNLDKDNNKNKDNKRITSIGTGFNPFDKI